MPSEQGHRRKLPTVLVSEFRVGAEFDYGHVFQSAQRVSAIYSVAYTFMTCFLVHIR